MFACRLDRAWLAPILAALFAAAPPAAAQSVDEPAVGVGYVVNIPNQFLGFSGRVITPWWGGMGVYVDMKFDYSSPADEPGFLEGVTVETVQQQFGDRRTDTGSEWTSFNVALLRRVKPGLTIYLGAGYSEQIVYREYLDEDQERGPFGFYKVKDVDASGPAINVLGGAFVHLFGNLYIQLGLESAPAGATVGGSYRFGL